ncbi:hypothetical protein AAMO2058_000131300 [Amorphochlora amoebiformis]
MPEAAPSTKLDQTLSRLAEEIEKGEEEGLTRQVGGLEEESAEISEVGVVSEEGVTVDISYRGETIRKKCPNKPQDISKTGSELLKWFIDSVDTTKYFKGDLILESQPNPDLEGFTWGEIIDKILISEEKRFIALKAQQDRRRQIRAKRREKLEEKKEERRRRKEKEEEEKKKEKKKGEEKTDGEERGKEGKKADKEGKKAEKGGEKTEKDDKKTEKDDKKSEKDDKKTEKDDKKTGKEGKETDKEVVGGEDEKIATIGDTNDKNTPEEEDDDLSTVSDDSAEVVFGSINIHIYYSKQSDHLVIQAPTLYDTPDLGVVKSIGLVEAKTSAPSNSTPVKINIRTMTGVHTIPVTVGTSVEEVKRILRGGKYGIIPKSFVLIYPQLGILHPKMSVGDCGIPEDGVIFVMPNQNPQEMESRHGPWYVDPDTKIKVNRLNPNHST